jgi:4-amino-4-deoxy-L-arabinose transferase-like glycosyltransferase
VTSALHAAPAADPPRGGRARARLAHPLTAVLVLVAVAGVAWALIVPPFQSPDEIDHYAYAESLAARGALPGSPGRPGYSTAQAQALSAADSQTLAFYVHSVRPPWDAAAVRAYDRQAAARPARGDGGGPNAEASNPPLLYLYDDVAYLLSGGNTFDRLYAMRLWNVLLLIGTAAATWLLVGESLRPPRVVQVVAASLAGLLPEATFIGVSINPDALSILLWTLGLWLATRVIRRAARPADAIGLLACCAAAILTKASNYALLPPAALALAIGIWLRPREERRRALVGTAAALPVLAVPVAAWFAITSHLGRPAVNVIATAPGRPARGFSIRNFISYVWQFYLPKLPGMPTIRTVGGRAVIEIWLKQGVAYFGWLDVPAPAVVYDLAGVAIAATAAGLVWAARPLRRVRSAWRRSGPDLALVALHLVAVVSLLGLLHIVEYRSLLAYDGPLLQGRYLLPLIGVGALAVAVALKQLPGALRAGAAGAILSGLVLGQLVALAAVTGAYFT